MTMVALVAGALALLPFGDNAGSAGPSSALEAVPASPGARGDHTAIYEPVGRRMVVFAGDASASGAVSGSRDVNDVWALSLRGPPVWSQLTPTGTVPAARSLHVAIYDPANQRMVIFGGFSPSAQAPMNDTWALSLSGTMTWTQLTPVGAVPAARYWASAVYDELNQRMVLFGGTPVSASEAYGDVWALSLSGTPVWTQLAPEGNGPVAQFGHVAVYDPVHQSMVVVGGGYPPHDATWSLSLSGTPRWTRLNPGGIQPPEAFLVPGVYDPVGQRLLVPDGQSYPGIYALSLGDTPVWQQLVVPGWGPTAFYQYSMVYDSVNRQAVTYGGIFFALRPLPQVLLYPGPYPRYASDVWALTGLGSRACPLSWMQLLPGATPTPVSFTSTRTLYLPVVGNLCGG